MKPVLKKWLLPLLAVVVLLLMIAWLAGTFSARVAPGTLPVAHATTPGAGSYRAELVQVPVTEAVPATIGARQATTISSRIIARITRVLVRAGDSVTEGQLLLELERSELESRWSQLKQTVVAVQARLTEARLALERATNLQQQGLVARATLDEARATNDALQAELASAQRAADEAEAALGYTEIRSPIDGRIVDRFAEPGDTASPGERLLSLYNPLSLRVEAAVRETLALPLEVGQDVQVEIPSLGRTLAAQIEELVPAADPGSRSFLVKARIELQDDLLPGMYARLLIPAGMENVVLIPPELVARFGQLDMVWVDRDGRTERRFVRLGRSFGADGVEVISGLEAGSLLVPQPQPAQESPQSND
jgi:RND family efflux transporter MFP subunit